MTSIHTSLKWTIVGATGGAEYWLVHAVTMVYFESSIGVHRLLAFFLLRL